jgi:hypothetical protein
MPRWEVIVLVAATGGMLGWWGAQIAIGPQVGALTVKTEPSNANVFIDDVPASAVWPASIDVLEGSHVVSVMRDGYVRRDEVVEIRGGETVNRRVILKPSRDTGYELTSDPPGGLVWFDGAPLRMGTGAQARADFRASEIEPGHHLIEIRLDRFKPWQQDIEVVAGENRKVHAVLVPLSPPLPQQPPCTLGGP